MRPVNLENVTEAGEFNRLPAGGYVCKYTHVEDVAAKEYLYMEYDIVHGDYRGYYAELSKNKGFWGGKLYRSYKETALPMFKRMCSAVSKSNPGFVFDGGKQNSNEKTLIGKYVGLVLGEEEYIGNDGNVKTRLYVARECDIKDIKEGKFTVPALKKLPETAKATGTEGFMDVSADDEAIPW